MTSSSPGTDIAVREEPSSGTLALTGDQIEWTSVQRAALAHIGIDQAPTGDQQVFMHVAQRTGLDPFARQIYMIPRQEGSGQNRKTKWTIQTGIDGFRLISERHPAYRGQVGPQWCGPDGEWRDVWVSDKPPAAARVGILRSDRDGPIWGTAMFSEYAQTKTWDGKTELTKMWRDKGAHMIGKCAEALARRTAFPVELGGLHTDEEMSRAYNTEEARPRVRATAPTTAELTGRPAAPDHDVVDAETVDTPVADPVPDVTGGTEVPVGADVDARMSQPQQSKLFALLREADVEDRMVWASGILGREVTSYGQLTVADASTLIERLQHGLDALAGVEQAAADDEARAQQ